MGSSIRKRADTLSAQFLCNTAVAFAMACASPMSVEHKSRRQDRQDVVCAQRRISGMCPANGARKTTDELHCGSIGVVMRIQEGAQARR